MLASTARGDGDADSDVDLLLVPLHAGDAGAPAWELAIESLSADVQRWSGNAAHVQTLTRCQLRRMSAVGDPLLASWRADGRLVLGAALDVAAAR